MAHSSVVQSTHTCGCDCESGMVILTADISQEVRCECRHCGPTGQGCQIICDPIRRGMIAITRGIDARTLFDALPANDVTDEMKQHHPLLCRGCLEHGLLELRRKAVRRRRMHRDEDYEHLNQKRCRSDQCAAAGA